MEILSVEFAGEIWYWRGPSPYHFVTVPESACQALRGISGLVTYGWGMVPVRARVGKTTWTTSLFPKNGGYLLPIRDSVRAAEGVGQGDTVAVRLEIHER